MALPFIGQVALGPVAQGLSNLILSVSGKVLFCGRSLRQLHGTLEDIIPRIEEAEQLDGQIKDRRRPDMDRLRALLKEGEELVLKGSNIQVWNCFKKYRYSNRIIKLNNALLRFFELNVPAESFRDIKEILVEVKGLNRKRDRVNRVANDTVVGGLDSDYSCFVPLLPAHPVGLAVPLKDLKMELFREGISVVGLCAPGGCGKTTLASMICRDDEVKSRFKKIFFLTVSSEPNWMLVLQRLWRHMRCSEPQFLSIEDAVTQLEGVLVEEPEPILLVLDDVWSETVLLKDTFKQSHHKILVTSRTVFDIFDSTYRLRMLSERDAKTLFFHSAFPEDGNYEKPNENLLNQVVEGCKGFPLTLTVIGKSLRQKPARKWQFVADMLSEGRSIFDSHKDLLDRLSPSIDLMKSPLQECFLDLGSFPEDNRIPASALIDMWIELYNLDEHEAYVNLLELSSKCLINLVEGARNDAGEIDGYFNELFVIQHDLLRDLAIHKSQETNPTQNKRLVMDRREDGLPNSWKEHQNQPFQARIVSIHTGEMEASSWFEMELPNAEVLMLNFSGKNYCLPPFLKKMEKLKVLLITNHGSKHAKLSGFPPVSCLPNLRRIRLEKISIPSLDEMDSLKKLQKADHDSNHTKLSGFPVVSSLLDLIRTGLEKFWILPLDEIKDSLKNMQKLSLVLCEVGEAFKDCSLEYSTIFPNLTEIDINYCNDLLKLPSEICESSNLRRLSITNCHNLYELPERIDQIKDIEVLRLHACTRLKELPDWICRLEKLRFLDISHCLNMEKMPEDFGQLQNLRKLDMRQCSRLKQLPGSAMKLEHLEEVVCDEETATLWNPLKRYLSELEIKVREEDINLDWLGFDFFEKRHF